MIPRMINIYLFFLTIFFLEGIEIENKNYIQLNSHNLSLDIIENTKDFPFIRYSVCSLLLISGIRNDRRKCFTIRTYFHCHNKAHYCTCKEICVWMCVLSLQFHCLTSHVQNASRRTLADESISWLHQNNGINVFKSIACSHPTDEAGHSIWAERVHTG